MKGSKKFLKTTLLLMMSTLMATSCLAGCSTKEVSQTSQQTENKADKKDIDKGKQNTPTNNKKKTMIFAPAGFPKVAQWSGNPNSAGGVGGAWEFVYEGLFRLVRYTDTVYKRLADTVKHDGNKTTITLVDAKWNDGEQLTSTDIWGYYMLNNGTRITRYLESIETPDEKTIVFTWQAPVPVDEVKECFLAETYQASIPYHIYGEYIDKAAEILDKAPKATDPTKKGAFGLDMTAVQEELNANWNEYTKAVPPDKKPVGTGPFMFDKMTDTQMMLIKNENYHRADEIKFDSIQLSQVTGEQGIALLKGAKTDTYPGSLPLDIAKSVLASNEDIVFYQMIDPACHGFYFNQESTRAPMDKKEFRQAINYIINKTPAREAGNYYGQEHPYSNTGIPPSTLETWVSPDVVSKMSKYETNPAKAEELLESIGCKKINGKWQDETGKDIMIVLGVNGGWTPAGVVANVATIVSDQLKAFGLNSEVRVVDGQVYGQKVEDGEEFDMTFEWTDVAWQFMYPYFPLESFYNGYKGHTKVSVDEDKVLDLQLEDWDGQSFDVKDSIDQLVVESDEAKRQLLIDQLVWAANENCFGINLYQNATGMWENRKNVANLPMEDQIDANEQWMMFPDDPELQEAVCKLNWGFAGIEKLLGEGGLKPR